MSTPKPLTERQQEYVDLKMTGRSPSVILGNVRDIDKNENVQLVLSEARDNLSAEVQITRADVVEGILGAINRAKLQAEPATEIAGWKEIGKILGHYAPEVKKVQLTDGEDTIVRKLESLTTQELLQLVQKKRAAQQATIVDVIPTQISENTED